MYIRKRFTKSGLPFFCDKVFKKINIQKFYKGFSDLNKNLLHVNRDTNKTSTSFP